MIESYSGKNVGQVDLGLCQGQHSKPKDNTHQALPETDGSGERMRRSEHTWTVFQTDTALIWGVGSDSIGKVSQPRVITRGQVSVEQEVNLGSCAGM